MESTENITLFDKYQIIRLLGCGSSGNVYLAEHMKLKAYRAIKIISKSHPLQPQFRLEADLLKNLSHPSIPIIYDIDEDDTFLYIIEEYVEGESLQKFMLHHDSISQQYIMQLGIQLCEIFIYLHSREPHPVCYQDLKPEHIIVCGNSVKIVDFGIASYITNQGKKFQQYGTIAYAAPEQYLGETLSPATDLYALGKVLWELQTQNGKKCSKNFNRIIDKLLNNNPARRYTTAVELKLALEIEFERMNPGAVTVSHLKYHIAVVGAKSGIGTTHIAAAITTYLNSQKKSCIYQSMAIPDLTSTLIRANYLSRSENNVYVNGNFKAKLHTEENVIEEEISYEADSYVLDFGSNIEACRIENAEYTILIIGGKEWEWEESRKAFERLQHTDNLIVICNYNHRQICRKYAEIFQIKVYSFPIDENPFETTREKQNLFQKIL